MTQPDDQDEGGVGLLLLLAFDGALLGAIGVVFTQLYVKGVPVPIGAVLSILILPWLVLRAGEVDPRPGWAGAPLAAWLVVLALLTLVAPGGDVLLPANWQSLVLFAGGLVAGLVALRSVVNKGYARSDDSAAAGRR
jgi:hypothetical protein